MSVDSVITLDNNINCLLLEKTVLENNNYFLSVILNEEEEPSDEYVVFKEILENGEKYVEKVQDETLLTELLKQFTNIFNTNVEKLVKEEKDVI